MYNSTYISLHPSQKASRHVLGPTDLPGYSLGGRVAMGFADRRHEGGWEDGKALRHVHKALRKKSLVCFHMFTFFSHVSCNNTGLLHPTRAHKQTKGTIKRRNCPMLSLQFRGPAKPACRRTSREFEDQRTTMTNSCCLM